jgi:peptidoglycan hydrolase-like protein with peptidoglycan-binding domain
MCACLSVARLDAAPTPTAATEKKAVAQKSTPATTPAAKTPTTHPSAPSAARKRSTAATSARRPSTVRRTGARRRRRRPLSGRQRLARLRLQPSRVTEIQQALIREGYLQGEPDGRWDTRTRAAMLHYQTDNGFPATGLPEAKSLMKLGLGPHPLPPELDPSLAKATHPDAPKGDSASEPPTPPVPASSPSPE